LIHLRLPSLLIAALFALAGCGKVVASATNRLAQDLGSAIMNQNDVETVKSGAPAYLLLIDGLIENDPDATALLVQGARLYGAYATAFVRDNQRAKRLTDRALDYAKRALCEESTNLCEAVDRPYLDFAPALKALDRSDLTVAYTWSIAKLGRIQAHSKDWNAIAELPKVESMLERIVELEPVFEDGAPHLYLGILATLRPPALGGRPAEGKRHFERALELSEGRNLTAKVQYAKRYARLVFDRELHDRLLKEVLAAETVDPGRTLMNALAKEEARDLLSGSKDFF